MLITVQEDGTIAMSYGAGAFQEQFDEVMHARKRAELRRSERELASQEEALDALRDTRDEGFMSKVLGFLAGILR